MGREATPTTGNASPGAFPTATQSVAAGSLTPAPQSAPQYGPPDALRLGMPFFTYQVATASESDAANIATPYEGQRSAKLRRSSGVSMSMMKWSLEAS